MATIPGKGENLIAGKVLTLGSPIPTDPNAQPPTGSRARTGANRGIRNLLVVCYDVDPSVMISPNVPVPAEEDVESVALEQVVGPSFWAKFPGQRLGSTLTDANGDWSFIYEDDLQSHAEPPRRIARPDLLIFVLAPEDTHEQLRNFPAQTPDLKELWVPDLVSQRVLHFSREVRLNAGRREHYVIRIDDQLLARAGVSEWIAQPGAAADPARTLDDFFNRQDQLLDVLRRRRREEFTRLTAIREQVRTRFSIDSDRRTEAGGRPHDFRASPVFRSPDGPPYIPAAGTSSPGVVIESVGAVVSSAIDRVRSPSVHSQRRRFRFRLTDAEARASGLLELDPTEIEAGTLMERYRNATASDTLLAHGSPLARCAREHEIDAAVARVMVATPPPPGPEVASEPPAFSYDLNRQIERILEQTAAPAYQPDELVADRLDSMSLGPELHSVKLQPGPADVTSYHHFHRLELALPHIWTELFDDGIRSRGEEIYTQLVRTQQDLLEESRTYRRAVDDLRDFRALIEAAEEAEDSGVAAWQSVLNQLPQITKSIWDALDPAARDVITELANDIRELEQDRLILGELLRVRADNEEASLLEKLIEELRQRAYDLVAAVLSEAPKEQPKGRLGRLVLELRERLVGPYKFTVFAPNTINFGLLVTYRQAWRPISYQVGRLVKTIPLAPGEAREYSIKRVEKKTRNQKEVENNLRIKKTEAESKATIESQIAMKAASKSNWKLSAEGSGSVGVFSASASASLEGGSESASEDTKKSMREAVQKANEEDKKEHNWEVATAEEAQVEASESVKISNPNQELPVTYLLYELQRQYRINEKLHTVQPVLLVANEVPAPHEVDEEFLISHDWIIRRALLDDEFQPALNYLSEGFAGDQFRIEVLRLAKASRLQALQHLKNQLKPYEKMLADQTAEVLKAGEMLARRTSDDDDENQAAWRIREQSRRDVLQRMTQERADIKSLVDRASADLAEAEKALADALQTHANMQTEITRLRIHVAQNIMYYMQAIWDTEHPDQRYFRLYNLRVPMIRFPDVDRPSSAPELPARHFEKERDVLTRDWVFETSLPPPDDFAITPDSWPTLGEVSDLDNLLGYKGNYMIFPLKNASDAKKGNYLTAYMAQSYVSDSGKGASDPDPAGDATLDELISYFRCIKEARERTHAEPGAPPRLEDDAEARQKMRELIAARITNPYKDEQELIVRTDSLFIEALPGSHPVLEDFKLRHRALDVQKVGAELRGQELENLRLAERLRAGEREDPRVDKRVEVKGATVLSVTEPEGPSG